MQLTSRNFCSLFFTLSLFWLIIDCFNGFCIANGINLPISQLFKLFLSLLLILGILKIRNGIILVGLIFFYIAFLSLHLLLNVSSPQIGTTINHLFRFIISVLIYFFINKYTKRYPTWSYKSIRRILDISSIVVILNIIAGLFG